jgi:hypothetical protein
MDKSRLQQKHRQKFLKKFGSARNEVRDPGRTQKNSEGSPRPDLSVSETEKGEKT